MVDFSTELPVPTGAVLNVGCEKPHKFANVGDKTLTCIQGEPPKRSNTFTCISLFGNIDKTSLFVRYFIEIIDNLSESTFTYSKKPMCKRVGKSEGAKQG